MKTEQTLYVYLSLPGTDLPLGRVFPSYAQGKEIFAFEYDPTYLSSKIAGKFFFDPDLSLYSGRQYAPLEKKDFAFLEDSSPDRWGRLLLQRGEENSAKEEKRPVRHLQTLDYLLGVNDNLRMGALRFKKDLQGPFLASESSSVPPFTSLRELEDVAKGIEQGDAISSEKLQLILTPGSSLGGARPKASVISPKGELWIAKFPSSHDSYDVGAFEMLTHDLALLSGLRVPEARLGHYSPLGSTFLSKRFDRNGEKRIPYASAMALLGKEDGDEASYLDLADFISASSPHPQEDLHELFKRLLFSLVVSNTDDHLRNHGFLYEDQGWALSPAFDLNPNWDKDHLALSIDGNTHALDVEAALQVASSFALGNAEAKSLLGHIQKIVSKSYFPLCEKYGIASESAKMVFRYFNVGPLGI